MKEFYLLLEAGQVLQGQGKEGWPHAINCLLQKYREGNDVVGEAIHYAFRNKSSEIAEALELLGFLAKAGEKYHGFLAGVDVGKVACRAIFGRKGVILDCEGYIPGALFREAALYALKQE